MKNEEINCAHACKDTCAMLKRAVELEKELAEFYARLDDVCDYPEVRTFLHDFTIQHRRMIEDIRGKLQQMEARGRILDDIIAGFDSTHV